MSIQSSINSGIAVASALYTQTPQYEAKKKEAEYKKAEADFKDQGKVFNELTKGIEIGEVGDKITKKQKALFKGKEGEERSLALDLANEGYVKAAEKMAELKPNAENFSNLAHRIERGEQRSLRRQELMDAANKKAEEKKEAKTKQMEKVKAKHKSFLDLETSLGVPLRALNLSKEQEASAEQQ